MQFGSKKVFGIESLIHQDIGDNRWTFGCIRLWIGGAEIGDFSRTFVFSLATSYFSELITRIDGLKSGELFSLEKSELLHLIHNALYGEEWDLEEASRLEDLYRNFVLCPGICEAFDGFFVICVAYQGDIRFVWSVDNDGSVWESKFLISDFVSVVRDFLKCYG